MRTAAPDLEPVSLREIVTDLRSGFARRPSGEATDVVQLRTNNIDARGWLDTTDLKRVRCSPAQLERFDLRRGDILFNNTNSPVWAGKTAFVADDLKYVYSNHLTRLRVDERRVSGRYVAHYLAYLWRRGYFQQQVRQWVNQASITPEQLLRIKLPVPADRKLQEAVADVLDQAVELVRRQIAQPEVATRSIVAAFNEVMRHPEARKWKRRSLGDEDAIESATYGTSGRSRAEPVGVATLRIPNVVQGHIDLRDLKYTELPAKDLANLRLRQDDVLFVRTNGNINNIGRAAAYNGDPADAIFASYLIRMRPRPKVFRGEYLAAWFNFGDGRDELLSQARTTAGQYNLSASALRSLSVPQPDWATQSKIVNVVQQARHVRAGLNGLIELHERLLASLRENFFSPDASAVLVDQLMLKEAIDVEQVPRLARMAEQRPIWGRLSPSQRRVWTAAVQDHETFDLAEIRDRLIRRHGEAPGLQHLAAMLDLLCTLGATRIDVTAPDSWIAVDHESEVTV